MLELIPLAAPTDDIFPFLLGALVFLTPIVAILARHQQKMAEIMRRHDNVNALPQHDDRVHAEIAALRQLMTQQSLAIDELSQSNRELSQRLDSDAVRERLRA